MIFNSGDYVSAVWVFDSPEARWAIWSLRRLGSINWELALTWDDKYANRDPKYMTVIHRVSLPGDTLEIDIDAKVENLITTNNLRKLSKQLGLFRICSSDPSYIADKLLSVTDLDCTAKFFLVFYDSPPWKKI